MADQRLLQILKLGRIQALSGASALAAFAGTLLPGNKARGTGEPTAAPAAELPPSTQAEATPGGEAPTALPPPPPPCPSGP